LAIADYAAAIIENRNLSEGITRKVGAAFVFAARQVDIRQFDRHTEKRTQQAYFIAVSGNLTPVELH
jgi:hypothetical protein